MPRRLPWSRGCLRCARRPCARVTSAAASPSTSPQSRPARVAAACMVPCNYGPRPRPRWSMRQGSAARSYSERGQRVAVRAMTSCRRLTIASVDSASRNNPNPNPNSNPSNPDPNHNPNNLALPDPDH
eukprot:scaffold23007_cov60-Phaeocystis_antarctica.AAC.6